MALKQILGKASKRGPANGGIRPLDAIDEDNIGGTNRDDVMLRQQYGAGIKGKDKTTSNGAVAAPIKGRKVRGGGRIKGGKL